ncbi:MAG: hypothetical protein GY898_24605 [Proteobacteria bacterium]|nr:hypothetical protein [Pseudomonadota bacterium]
MLRFVPLMAIAAVLSACPTGGPEEIPDITWDPPLIDDNSGELDFGVLQEGENAQMAVTGTNNTDETITFDIDWDLEIGEGWIVTASETFDAEPGGTPVTFGPRYNASGASPDESSGTVTFIWDQELVTYIIRVEVDH